MKELTKAEEQVMQQLWELKETNVKGIIEKLPEPKPAYNTISTIVRILENKGFVDHQKAGKGYIYFPLVSKEQYKKKFMKRLISNYFQGSFKEMVSFFAKEGKMDISEFEELMNDVKEELDQNTEKPS
ncbi:BlaI/MecI/CopY family transcriptional regulator [Saccharicrinis fermentans]|uniref:Methicillin resistance regulatory protein MecI n=1 Tax=Saccharicrinis fermentans DSM 9555 = JCM 21142 TaxID=869213 RepID=W7Y8A9_9BACT|nr:BlaI/MecI/CopY family transcriptional regulator [Saccharicrinis fermentans]GAF04487.1 methicillin resistance regulatory protein MecI [Saccharicrinis fermentans DSM 9555 = JCM 21142]